MTTSVTVGIILNNVVISGVSEFWKCPYYPEVKLHKRMVTSGTVAPTLGFQIPHYPETLPTELPCL